MIFFGTALLLLDVATRFTSTFAYIVPPTASSRHHSPAFVASRTLQRPSSHLFQSDSNSDGGELKNFGLNELQTLLREAVVKEEFLDAASFSDELFERLYGGEEGVDMSPEDKKAKRRRMSWRGQGAAPWLVDRLDALNYTLPTTIQINAMESVNQILSGKSNIVDDDEYERSMEERISETGKDMGDKLFY